ncbi:MAG: BrnT family toxin [Dehalococcoidia bacterium]
MPYVRRLTWDAWNVSHILRHGVSPDEVEEVCNGQHVVRETYQRRLILIGPTLARRMLSVVLEPEAGQGDAYYPVTARPASRRERRIYRDEKGIS